MGKTQCIVLCKANLSTGSMTLQKHLAWALVSPKPMSPPKRTYFSTLSNESSSILSNRVVGRLKRKGHSLVSRSSLSTGFTMMERIEKIGIKSSLSKEKLRSAPPCKTSLPLILFLARLQLVASAEVKCSSCRSRRMLTDL